MSRAHVATLALASLIAAASACASLPATLTQLIEARRLASELHVEFTKATEASNRAVMADTDEASTAAAGEARGSRQLVEKDVEALRSILQALGYSEDLRMLEGFIGRFDEYRRVDDEILPLAVENTNLKAQRLSFGAGQEAASAFSAAVEEAARAAKGKGACCAQAAAASARAALLEIQVLQAPHIAESDDAAMTRLETQMELSTRKARAALTELKAPAAAAAALERFVALNTQIIGLSRRNSNVRSLALSLGRKRMVTAACEDDLQALKQALDKHGFSATR